MAKMNSYTDYKSGTTSGEQEKLLETGKVLFSGKKTTNGDPVTLSIPVSELVGGGGSDIPDVGTDTNRGNVLKVNESDELVWAATANLMIAEQSQTSTHTAIPSHAVTKFKPGYDFYYDENSGGLHALRPMGGYYSVEITPTNNDVVNETLSINLKNHAIVFIDLSNLTTRIEEVKLKLPVKSHGDFYDIIIQIKPTAGEEDDYCPTVYENDFETPVKIMNKPSSMWLYGWCQLHVIGQLCIFVPENAPSGGGDES